jgi:hypothetical protein
MAKTPEQVLGRYFAKKNYTEPYQDGDWHFDAREIINTLSRNGFKIIRRRKKSRKDGKEASK